MGICEAHAGRRYPPTPAYRVSAAKVAEFVRALGDDNPAYSGPVAVAPPTFATVIAATAWEQMFTDPDLGLALRRTVHADQTFTWSRPLRVGDEVTAALRIDRVRERGATDLLSTTVEVTSIAGEPVCTVAATFLHSREAV